MRDLAKNDNQFLKPGHLGAFTTYDIEYVFDYLGKSRILDKMNELKNRPTMGIPFESFLTGNGDSNYFSGKGVFWVFSTILHAYFRDPDVGMFLFTASQKYTEDNYYSGKHISQHWRDFCSGMTRMINRDPDRERTWIESRENQYWKEFHFFVHSIFDIYPSLRTHPENAIWLLKVFEYYDCNIQIITEKVRREPGIWPENGLANAIVGKIVQYFKSRKEINAMAELEIRYRSLGWRV